MTILIWPNTKIGDYPQETTQIETIMETMDKIPMDQLAQESAKEEMVVAVETDPQFLGLNV